jgi:nucleoside-triphosphatase THEP1
LKNSILIFSQPIRSGKTTLIAKWRKNLSSCGGFLSPDINGVRVLEDLRSGEIIPFELPENAASASIQIGRFRFSREAFNRAGEILQRESILDPDWLVIDEIGKLELEQNDGFEPWASWLISKYKSGAKKGRLVLVVRESLLHDAINKYQLQDVEILSADFFKL